MKTRFYTTRGIPTIAREILGAQTSNSSPFLVKDLSNAPSSSVHSAWKGFDGATTNPAAGSASIYGTAYGGTSTSGDGWWWQITFPTKRYIVGLSLFGNSSPQGYYGVGSFVVTASNDEDIWTILYTRTATTNLPASWTAFNFAQYGWYKHYRLTLYEPTNVASNIYGVGFQEVKFSELTYN